MRRPLQAFQPGLFDLLDLPTDDGKPSHVASELVKLAASTRRRQVRLAVTWLWLDGWIEDILKKKVTNSTQMAQQFVPYDRNPATD